MYFYKRIRDTREDHDQSQKEIALILKTTQQNYCRYEKGEIEIPLHHLITLANLWNVSLDYLTDRI